MDLWKEMDPQMSDDLKKTWLVRCLPKALQEVVFYAEEIDMVKLEERQ